MSPYMTVVVDGKEQEREVDFVEEYDNQLPRAWPVTLSGEGIMWIVGDVRPHIVPNVWPI